MGNADETKEEDLFFFGKDDDDFIVVDAREDEDDDGATRAVDAFADAANMMMRCVFCYGWMMFLSHFIRMRKVCGEKLGDIFVWDKNNAEMQRSSPIQLTDDGFRWAESSFFFSAKAKEIFRDVCFCVF